VRARLKALLLYIAIIHTIYDIGCVIFDILNSNNNYPYILDIFNECLPNKSTLICKYQNINENLKKVNNMQNLFNIEQFPFKNMQNKN